MAELAHGTQPEFWRPPIPKVDDGIAVPETATSMAQVCPRCSSEYLLGAHFCHSCGARRPETIHSAAKADHAAFGRVWEQTVQAVRTTAASLSLHEINAPAWLHYLSFHEIKSRVGLSTASLVAFLIGLGCVAGALLVGFLTVKTFVDWQAIQFYREEWLLAATASFVAGILLKKQSHKDDN